MRLKDTIGISVLMTDLQHVMSLKIANAIKSLGLTLPQYSALSILKDSSGLSNAELARKCNVTPQTMNRIMDLLLKLRFVDREDDPHHGLKVKYIITAKAEKLICKAHVLVHEVEELMLSEMTEAEYKKFEHQLKDCMDILKSKEL